MGTAIDLFKDAVRIMDGTKDKFVSLVRAEMPEHVFKQEMLFASQAMMSNEYLAKVAVTNALSLRNAFTQLAVSGLTLNPSRQLAYLVPRDRQVILDVSWRGMVKIAVTDGAIKDCIVELVYSNDKFEYRGKRMSPIHSFNPFAKKADRGEFIGCYVEAALPDGRVHVEAVTADEVWAARDASELWKKNKSGPWKDHTDAMCKKSAIKIARKYWPQVGVVLDEVIHYLNQDGGEGYVSKDISAEVIERFVDGDAGDANAEPLPTSNDAAPVTIDQPAQAAGEAMQEAPATTETAGTIEPNQAPKERAEDASQAKAQQADSEAPQDDSQGELPPKVIKRVDDILARARLQGSWAAAKEHINGWGNESWRSYALKKLEAARYESQSRGE